MTARRFFLLTVLALAISCAGAGPATEADESNQAITNNQESGVDEGGIVKNVGDHLVILRSARLFTVNVSESGAMRQDDSVSVPIHDELANDVWYDEMLVHGRDVYVVGYRWGVRIDDEGWRFWGGWYNTGTTEINHFVLGQDGKIRRKETLFVESSDYFDWRNYTSRMIDDRLVFYLPFWARKRGRVPHLLRWTGTENRFRRIAKLYDDEEVTRWGEGGPIRHTVISCDVSDGELSRCSGRAFEGPWWNTRYVTNEDVFLWADDKIVAFSLVDGSITAHAVTGNPVDQFSFHWDGSRLRVITQEWQTSHVQVNLLSLRRDAFDEQGAQWLAGKVLPLAPARKYRYVHQNRFVDGWALLSLRADGDQFRLLAYELEGGRVREFDLGGAWTNRIEPLAGVGALVSATTYTPWRIDALELRALTIGDDIRLASTLSLEAATEGEHRSHAFFFKPNTASGGGVFGLPVVGRGGKSGWWGRAVSNVAFFGVSPAGELALRGAVSASDEGGEACEASCIDWYGNTRPIFLRDQVFALMGSEIAEVSFTSDEPRVVQRLYLR